jgi:hypothetical protein
LLLFTPLASAAPAVPTPNNETACQSALADHHPFFPSPSIVFFCCCPEQRQVSNPHARCRRFLSQCKSPQLFVVCAESPSQATMTPEQQEEFKKAVQQHIQLAVNAALANMPQQPPQPAAVMAVTVNTVAVKLPEFWTADPNTWFSRSNVAASYTKYDHVLMKLPCDVVMSVRDLVNSMQHVRTIVRLINVETYVKQ